ncbi:MAG: hypothetical protein ABEJ74_06920 [Haloferacaceae archaeon]
MALYDRVADLPLRIESTARTRRERDTSSGFRRVTTTFELAGDGRTGRGEDVTYATADHDALAEAPPFDGSRADDDDGSRPGDDADRSDAPEPVDLTGEFTVDSFSTFLDGVDLFPTKPPEEERFRHYRRWAVESAALDLALKQAGQSLGEALDRSYDLVRFVVSTRLPDGEPDRVQELLAAYPDLELKLDPTEEWDEALIETLVETGAVRILDLKGHYEGTEVDTVPDRDLYARLFEAFPEAVFEDPALTDETDPIVRSHAEQVSWDAPITGIESVEALPFAPEWLNVKPSRFGTVESVLDTLAYCEREGIRRYAGGQFELGVGRAQVQALASLFYPDAPNDVAPREFNEPEVREGLPTSPLDAPAGKPGFGP